MLQDSGNNVAYNGTVFLGTTPHASQIANNTQCTMDLGQITYVDPGTNDVSLHIPVQSFSTTFQNFGPQTKQVYSVPIDRAGQSPTAWPGTSNGTWVVAPAVLQSITVNTNPSGRSFSVDGGNYTSGQTFSWSGGSQHTIAVNSSTQAGNTGTQYVWASWSDSQSLSHTVTVPNSAATYTANFTTQYQLTTSANPAAGGTISPGTGWVSSGAVTITATPSSGYAFTSFTGAPSATQNPQTITLSGPLSVTANFTANGVGSISSTPASQSIVQGGTAQYSLSITPPSGFTGAMVLSTSSLPPGTSANFSPSSVTGNSSSVLAIGTNFPNTPTGTYSIIVSAVGGGIVQAQSTVTMIVTAGGGTSISSSSTVIPFGWVSHAETLMFNSNTNTGTAPWYFSVVIQNAGTFAANGNVVAANACYVQYLAPGYGDVLVLYGDDGATQMNPGGNTPGTQHQFSNSRCTLDITRSYVQTIGGAMTLHLALTFEPTWSGVKEMFVDTSSVASGNELAWTNRGSWTVPSNKLIPVTTDHYDVFRTGANVHETILTPATAGSLAVKNSFPLDNCAWAQPLYVPNVSISGVLHNVLYVATSNATIYAYDADTTVQNPVPLWTRSLGTPFRPGHPDIWNCSNGTTVNGPAGIIGTPVIDLSTNTMYVVGNLSASGNQHKLFAIEITSGNDKLPPVVIASSSGVSPAFLASTHNQRPGLLLADYRVLFGYASFGDGPPYQGWMFNFNRGSLGLLDNWNYVNATSPGGAGIWMSGGGPAFDGRSVYFSTGNPKPDSFVATQYGNSLLRVDPQEGTSPGNNGIGLAKINQYLPPQAANWGNDADKDLGSSRVIVVPGTNYALVGGKVGNIYVVDRSTNQQSTLYSPFNIAPGGNLNTGGPEISGGLAYWNGTIYTWAQADKLSSFSLNGTSANTPNSLYTPRGEQGSALSISSNFDTNGLLWAVYPDGDDASHNNNSTGQMLVYRASDLSFLATYDLTGDHFIKFTPPVVANGKVFVVTQGKWASSPAIPPRVLVYGQ